MPVQPLPELTTVTSRFRLTHTSSSSGVWEYEGEATQIQPNQLAQLETLVEVSNHEQSASSSPTASSTSIAAASYHFPVRTLRALSDVAAGGVHQLAHGYGSLSNADGKVIAEGLWEHGWMKGGGKLFHVNTNTTSNSNPATTSFSAGEVIAEGNFLHGLLSEGWFITCRESRDSSDSIILEQVRYEGSFSSDGRLIGRARVKFLSGTRLDDECEMELVTTNDTTIATSVLQAKLSQSGLFPSLARVVYKYASGEVFEGMMETKNSQRVGYGRQYNNTGELIAAGLWNADRLVSTEPVPTACLLIGQNIPSDVFSKATLLFNNGSYYIGGVIESAGKIVPHGEGSVYSPKSSLLLLHALWSNGLVTERKGGAIDRINVNSDEFVSSGAQGFYVGQVMNVAPPASNAPTLVGRFLVSAAPSGRVPHGVCRQYDHQTGKCLGEGKWVKGRMVNGWCYYSQGLYEGEWSDGLRNGQGRFTYLEGTHKGEVYEGEWKRNIRVGVGTLTKVNGEVYDGEWDGNLRRGYGIEWSRTGKVLKMGTYSNLFQSTQPVPRSAIIGKKFLPELAQSASLIYPNLNFFVGPLAMAPAGSPAAIGSGGNKVPHGVGKMYNQYGLVLSEGEWQMGQQIRGTQATAEQIQANEQQAILNQPAPPTSASSEPSVSEFQAPVVQPEFNEQDEARLLQRERMSVRMDALVARTAATKAASTTTTTSSGATAQSLAQRKADLQMKQQQLAARQVGQSMPSSATNVTATYPTAQPIPYMSAPMVSTAPMIPAPTVTVAPSAPAIQQFSTVKSLMDRLSQLLNNRNVVARIEAGLHARYQSTAHPLYMSHGSFICEVLRCKPSIVQQLNHPTHPMDVRMFIQNYPPGTTIVPDPVAPPNTQPQPGPPGGYPPQQMTQSAPMMQSPHPMYPNHQVPPPQQHHQQQQQQQRPPSLYPQPSQPVFYPSSSPPNMMTPAAPPQIHSPLQTMMPPHNPTTGVLLHGASVRKKSHANRHNWLKRYLELYSFVLNYSASPPSVANRKVTSLPLNTVVDCSIAKRGVGKGSDAGVRFNVLLQDKRIYEFITDSPAECQLWNVRINQAMVDLRNMPRPLPAPTTSFPSAAPPSTPHSTAAQVHPLPPSQPPSMMGQMEQVIVPAVAIQENSSLSDQFISGAAKIHQYQSTTATVSSKLSTASDLIDKQGSLGHEVVQTIGHVADGVAHLVGKVFPPFAIVFELISLITKKASEAKTNQSNCHYLADRCQALRGVLVTVRDHWAEVEQRALKDTTNSIESQTAMAQLNAVLPLFQKVIDELKHGSELLDEHSGMSTFRKFISSQSIQSRFQTCDSNITKVVQDLTFGLSADSAVKTSEILQSLQSSMPYLNEKVDQVLSQLSSNANSAEQRHEILHDQLSQLHAHHDDVHSALVSSRGHLASMKRLGLKQQEAQTAANKRVEEMANMLQLIIQQQQQQQQSSSPATPQVASPTASPIHSVGRTTTAPPSATSSASSAGGGTGGSFNFNHAFEISPDEITLESEAGRGSFGVVYRGEYRGQRVAIKKLLLAAGLSPDDLRREFQREVQALCNIRHNRLILAYGACTNMEDPFIVTEWLEKGSLFDCLHPSPAIVSKGLQTVIPDSMKLPICIQILEGINYLHLSRPPIIHRDIKSANILIDANYSVRISDFGFAKSIGTSQESIMSSGGGGGVGTVAYMSSGLLVGESVASTSTDMYSIGVLIWEIFTGEIPWKNMQVYEIVMKVGVKQETLLTSNLTAPAAAHMPQGIREICTSLFQQDDTMRPTASQVLQLLLKEAAREKAEKTV